MDGFAKDSRRKILGRRLRVVFGILIIPFLLCGALSLVATNWPRYIILEIPSPRIVQWDYSARTVHQWHDTGGKYFIWRTETRLYPHTDSVFETRDGVVEYFNSWFTNRGWKRNEIEGYTPCHYLPESEFLERGYEGYLEYKPENWKLYENGSTVCLAVWEIEN